MGLTQEDLKELCINLYEIDVLKFGDFVTKVGLKTPVYIDLRSIISYPKLMDKLTDIIYNFMKQENISSKSVCGIPYTALPMATALSVKYDIPMLMRRKDVKTYGTKKLIEGVYQSGDECLIIEDIVTSGTSIIETINDLVSVGIKVTNIITIVNREQGGEGNLRKLGYKLHSLFTMTDVMNFLYEAKKINKDTVDSVKEYLSNNQATIKKADIRINAPFGTRSLNAKCKITSKLINIMLNKKSNLCVAVDVTSSDVLINLAKLLGPHIAILKTHSDAIVDFTEAVQNQLLSIAKEFDFLIMEDRKLADIGATVGHQFNLINKWAHLVTVHSISGPGPLKEIEKIVENNDVDRGVFLIAQLSCEKNLIDEKYTQETLKLAQSFSHLVVGLVCQSKSILEGNPEFLQLTPGVHISQTGDNKGQQYNTPENVIIEKGADIAVIGRGITQADDKLKAVQQYQKILWECYEKRVQQ